MRWAFENTSEMQKTRAVGGCFLHFSGVLRCPEAREVQNIVIQIKAPFMQRVYLAIQVPFLIGKMFVWKFKTRTVVD